MPGSTKFWHFWVLVQGACAGARQLEVTINGIGERAGNASLEEVSFLVVSNSIVNFNSMGLIDGCRAVNIMLCARQYVPANYLLK